MKKTILFIIITVVTLSLSAQNSGIGLGIVWKGPTGLSAKVWTGDNIAFDVAATWSLDNERTLHLHADMLFHNFNLITNSLPVYYGFGPQVKLADDPIIGVRVPVGIAYQVSGVPLDIFLDISFVMLYPDSKTSFNIGRSLGIRYFFK